MALLKKGVSQMNRSVRVFLAVVLFVLAALIAINNIVGQQTELSAWWLPLLLVIIGLALLLLPAGWSWRGVSRAEEAEADAAVQALQAPPAPALLAAPEPVAAAISAPEPAAAVEPAQPDDLTKVEGIGPKMDAALKAAGITTFARLAQTSEDDLRAAVAAAGMHFAPSIPTWAEQAGYAARGDWDGLAAFQAALTAGRKE